MSTGSEADTPPDGWGLSVPLSITVEALFLRGSSWSPQTHLEPGRAFPLLSRACLMILKDEHTGPLGILTPPSSPVLGHVQNAIESDKILTTENIPRMQ